MNYIVMDLEWNQSANELLIVEALPFEIIEIGAVKLNHRFEKIDEFSRLVCPQQYCEMHHITKNLIHLNIEELRSGELFCKVAEDFFSWCGEDYIFCTWGPMDLTELQRNMAFYDMHAVQEGPIRFFDVQKLFSIALEDGKLRRSLEYAVDFLGILKDIPFHRAYGDAYYTAKVLKQLDPCVFANYSFNTFFIPKRKKDEVAVIFDTYAKYITRGFETKAELLADREIMSTKCYICRKNIKRKLRWFTANGKHYYSLSFCDKHGYMKAKVRVRKSEKGLVYGVKTTRFITDGEVQEIREKHRKTKPI